jgi:signal transduction histidine kinase
MSDTNSGVIASKLRVFGAPLGWLRADALAAGALAAAVAAAAGAVVLTLTSDHLRHPTGDALFLTTAILGPAVAGAMWLRYRPSTPMGLWLLALAASGALISLQSVDDPLVFSLAVLADVPYVATTFAVLLAFPGGRLRDGVDKAILAGGTAVLAAFYVAYALLAPSLAGGQPLAQCDPACPTNPLQIGSGSTDTLLVIGKVAAVGATIVGAALATVLLRRFVTGTRPQRRAMFWIAAVGTVYSVVFASRQLLTFAIDSPDWLQDTLRWSLAGVRLVLPWAFVAALLHARLFAGAALVGMVRSLAAHGDARRWEREVGSALGDPSLRFGFWSAADDRYMGTDGATLVPPASGSMVWLPLERGGVPLGGIRHDSALLGYPELIEAVATATLLALETDHMHVEVREARLRTRAAAEDERRRLERDLHDGAQQQLIALRIKLGLAPYVPPRDSDRLFTELAQGVEDTLEELRRLAQGIYPPLLAEEGLASALRAAARLAPRCTVLAGTALGRFPADVESAVYFSCLEAIQNATKHAGPAARVTVRLTSDDGEVRFAVEDDGVGFRQDPRAAAGMGLRNISERIGAVGGALDVVSSPGHGTIVRGRVPVGTA